MLYLSSKGDVAIHGLHALKEDPCFRYFNPSVTVVSDHTFISLRMVNLERSDITGKFYLLRPHSQLQNEIVIGEFDANFACVRQFDVDSRDAKTGAPYIAGGFEDLRILASPENVVQGIACMPGPGRKIRSDNEMTFDAAFAMKMCRIEFGPSFEIAKVVAYESPFRRLREKNWSPFFYEGRLCVVYQWHPLILLELAADGTTRFIKWFHPSRSLKELRGGSPGIATRNGYLFVVHRRLQVGGKSRFSHLFVELGHDLQPLRISEEFSFFSTGLIEYCAGLAHSNGRYLLTFGLNDSLPFVAEVREDSVERLLKPFPSPIVENKAILGASYDERFVEAAADFPRDCELGWSRLAKLRIKAWLKRVGGRETRA